MMQVDTIGLDIAKNVFHVHGIARQLRRGQMSGFFTNLAPCLVGMEACATAHHWARAYGARAYRAFDAAGLREGLCEAKQKRRRRYRRHLRGGDAAQHALRSRQNG